MRFGIHPGRPGHQLDIPPQVVKYRRNTLLPAKLNRHGRLIEFGTTTSKKTQSTNHQKKLEELLVDHEQRGTHETKIIC